VDWFPPTDAYLKRTHIRKLIFELVENHGSHEGFSPDDGDNHHCSEYIDNRIGGQCHFFNEEASTSCSGKGIEMFPTYNTCNMVLKEHFEPKAAWGTSLRHCQSFDQRSLSSSNHLFNNSRHLQSFDQRSLSSSNHLFNSSRHCQSFDQPSLSSSNHLFNNSRHLQSFDQRSLSSSNHLFNSSRHCQSFDQPSLSSSNHLFNSSRHCQSFDQRSLLHMNDSTDTINFPVDPLIDISQHSNMMSTGNKNWYPHLSYQGTPTLQLHHISDDAVDNNVINGDVQIIDNINLDFWNERPPKKRRLMPPWVEVMES